MEQIPRLTDLIPRSLWPYGLMLLLGLGIIAGLEWLYGGLMPQWTTWTTDGTVAAFDLDGEGTLAVWFSSTTLLLASGTSVIVYLVRRYRRDDYQGRYRIWLWAAGCWLLLSLDETASLHEGFKKMMVLLTGQSLGGDGSLWWAAAYFFLLGGIGVRLLLDMRESWLSSGVFVGVAVCYATAVGTQLEWLFPQSGRLGIMIEEGAEMLGDWLLLLAMMLHARHVILDAEGQLPQKRPTGSSAASHPTASRVSASESASTPGISGGVSTGQPLVVHPPQSASTGSAHWGLSGLAGGGGSSVGAASALGSSSSWAGVRDAGSSSSLRQTIPQVGVGQASSEAGSPYGGVRRPLTEAEKKALRRKLEKLRKQREEQGNS